MSVGHIDFGAIAPSTDVTTIRAAEEARPVADQQNFQAQFKEEVDNNQHSVNAKNDVDGGQLNANADEKGSNEYLGDGGRRRKEGRGEEDSPTERTLSTEQMEKMANNMHDRNGKPIDFRISSGFDLKI